MRTFSPKPDDITRQWHVIDAEGVVLGRLATTVATLLRGKHKPIFAPHADTGDHVVVVNAAKIVLTAGKAEKKIAYRHSGYPGGLRATKYTHLIESDPEDVVRRAVRGMLPRTRLGRAQLNKLKIYAGAEHPHEAQQPAPYKLDERARARA
ncbi:MAG: 50S ribosomal protein L13 [Acidimicrobiales bacterium]